MSADNISIPLYKRTLHCSLNNNASNEEASCVACRSNSGSATTNNHDDQGGDTDFEFRVDHDNSIPLYKRTLHYTMK